MESHQDLSPPEEPGSPLHPQDGKLQRIAAHTQGLIADLRQWIDLRLDLALLELEERVDELRNKLALGLTLAFLAFFAVLFGLTTLALGLGWLFGHAFWGFLAVFGLLMLTVLALRAARPALMPSSDLFRRVRGGDTSGDEEDSDRPSREASFTVEGEESSEEASSPSS